MGRYRKLVVAALAALVLAMAVLIEEKQNKHPAAFALWIRGYMPHVQTLGDGNIQLFADAKQATIQARKQD